MGGGVSKTEYERIRKELITKEQVIRTLQDRLQETAAKAAEHSVVNAAAAPPKVSRLSHAVVTSDHKPGTYALIPNDDKGRAMGTLDEGEGDGDRTSSSKNHGKRRVEISAEIMSKKKIMSPEERVVYPKNDATKDLIMKILQTNVLFSGQTSAETSDCLDAFIPMRATPGTLVIRQGDQGEHFYVVESGQLEILVAVAGSPTPIRYGFLGAGMGFGELALLCNMPRAATIKAVTDVNLWSLERNTFREILASHKLMRLNKALQILQGIVILNKLTHSELQQVAAAMEWEEYEVNTTIIRQGESGEHFYIITQGEIMVTQVEAGTGKEVQIRTMRAGDHFGEMALFKDEVRSATCTAMSHVQCLTMGREHFIAMLGTIQELMDLNG
ncbi:TPA: hypothetical protein N0F65_012487 [Lagenidium giganteum]|uniref:Cyclic nucleotide-binding domain-containing protein n=1 Tax=Lagenidium giganteum TaxID=4803 RepID=A0AAV2YQA7_9STRA|nr:TPA: hypothetical protein N0F65_012487 [Lagenidium giganteum]